MIGQHALTGGQEVDSLRIHLLFLLAAGSEKRKKADIGMPFFQQKESFRDKSPVCPIPARNVFITV